MNSFRLPCVCASLVLAPLCAPLLCHAAPGDLDITFGGTGKVTTAISIGSDFGRSVATQSDGKIVVGGTSGQDFAVVRYNADGTLDMTFGSTGKVTTAISSGSDVGNSVAVQSDGKIVVAGYVGSNYDFAVVRYNANGTLDSTFNGTGKVTTGFGSTDLGHCVAMQSDGKIIVSGYTASGGVGTDDIALVRYNADGSLDTTFNGTGKVTTDFGSSNDSGNSVAVQSDGKIVVAGSSGNNPNTNFMAVRYNANGSLDTTFNGTGKVTTDLDGGDDYGQSVALQSDGKILVAGLTIGSNNGFAVVRYDANGSLDTTFNGTGKATTNFGGTDNYGKSVTVLNDGRIVVAGAGHSGRDREIALVCYNADGTLNTGFGGTGKVTTDVGSSDDVGQSVAVQSDGKIVVAGTAYNGSNDDFAVVRYHGIVPNIIVEQPAGTPLAFGSVIPVDLGPVVAGGSSSKVIAIRNTGAANLTGLAITLATGGNPADFAISALGATTLNPGAATNFTITFAP